ncbi:hypothetical protein EV714DRAFT_239376 [Schizophyllum commune]
MTKNYELPFGVGERSIHCMSENRMHSIAERRIYSIAERRIHSIAEQLIHFIAVARRFMHVDMPHPWNLNQSPDLLLHLLHASVRLLAVSEGDLLAVCQGELFATTRRPDLALCKMRHPHLALCKTRHPDLALRKTRAAPGDLAVELLAVSLDIMPAPSSMYIPDPAGFDDDAPGLPLFEAPGLPLFETPGLPLFEALDECQYFERRRIWTNQCHLLRQENLSVTSEFAAASTSDTFGAARASDTFAADALHAARQARFA